MGGGGGEGADQEQVLLSGEEAAGVVYMVVHVCVISSDDAIPAPVTPTLVLLWYVDVEVLGSIVGVAVFLAGIEEYQGGEPGVGAVNPDAAALRTLVEEFEFRGRMCFLKRTLTIITQMMDIVRRTGTRIRALRGKFL